MRAKSRRGPRPKEISDLVRDLLRARAPRQDEPTPNEAAPIAVAEGTRRAAPCSTIASDSPRPGRRPHQRRRSAPSSNSSDEDGGRAIRE